MAKDFFELDDERRLKEQIARMEDMLSRLREHLGYLERLFKRTGEDWIVESYRNTYRQCITCEEWLAKNSK